jgi:hypothetical protein
MKLGIRWALATDPPRIMAARSAPVTPTLVPLGIDVNMVAFS